MPKRPIHKRLVTGGPATAAVLSIVLAAAAGCPLLLPTPDAGEPEPDPEDEWELLAEDERGALLSLWGPSSDDVWVVGADARDDTGPTVLRVRGGEVERLPTGEPSGDLWWVHGFDGGPVFMGGSGGLILRYLDGNFEKLSTPTAATVFGLWGATPDDMWAVGGASDSGGGFAWRLQGDEWVPEASLPDDVADTGALWKVHGRSADDAWIVGSNGLSFHWDGSTLEPGSTGVGSSLFTVHEAGGRYVAVGGLGSGILVENEGEGWTNVTPASAPPGMVGVSLHEDGRGFAVGTYGSMLERSASGWGEPETFAPTFQDLHATWLDPDGGVWVVGGNTSFIPMTGGVLAYRAP